MLRRLFSTLGSRTRFRRRSRSPPPPQAYATFAAASAPAGEIVVEAVMEEATVGASGANTGFQPPRTTTDAVRTVAPPSAGVPACTCAAPSAEVDLNDDSIPVPDVPVSRRTRLSLALASVLPAASGTTQGTVEGPVTWSATARRVTWADEREWDDEYDATTEEEFDDSNYMFFDDDDVDGIIADEDEDDTPQHAGETSGDYEARLNDAIPPSAHFCCRPVFS